MLNDVVFTNNEQQNVVIIKRWLKFRPMYNSRFCIARFRIPHMLVYGGISESINAYGCGSHCRQGIFCVSKSKRDNFMKKK